MIESIFYLALCVYHEAQDQPITGQKAVVQTILNRVETRHLGIKDVIYERYQFSWTCDGKPDSPRHFHIFVKCGKAVVEALADRMAGKTLHGANYYFNPKLAHPDWAKDFKFVARIKDHDFYKGEP